MKKLLGISMIYAAALCHPAQAIENNTFSTPTGLFFFGSGILPPPTPGGTFSLRTVGAEADTIAGQNGKLAASDFNLSVNVTTPAYIYMTPYHILGADYGLVIAQPIFTFNGGFHIQIPHGPTLSFRGHTTGFGNTAIDPFLLQWKFLEEHLFLNTGFIVQPPDGSYRKRELFNPATNYWTFGPHAAVTYITPFGQEVSVYTEMDFNTTNPATKYHTGTEFKGDWAIGQHIGDFTVGPAGYFYQQIEKDRATSLQGATVQARVFAAGLSVAYLDRGYGFSVQGTITRDFGAISHLAGTTGAIRAGLSF